jgi:hypothetical protein
MTGATPAISSDGGRDLIALKESHDAENAPRQSTN